MMMRKNAMRRILLGEVLFLLIFSNVFSPLKPIFHIKMTKLAISNDSFSTISQFICLGDFPKKLDLFGCSRAFCIKMIERVVFIAKNRFFYKKSCFQFLLVFLMKNDCRRMPVSKRARRGAEQQQQQADEQMNGTENAEDEEYGEVELEL